MYYFTTDELDVDSDEDMPEGMVGVYDIDIDVPRRPKSHRGTWKGTGKGSIKSGKSYKDGKNYS